MKSIKLNKKTISLAIIIMFALLTFQFTTFLNGASQEVKYKLVSEWNNGAIIQVDITNTDKNPLKNWSVDWKFTGNQEITSIWSASFSQTGKNVTVKSNSWNSVIKPLEKISFGFLIKYSDVNESPINFSVTGTKITQTTSILPVTSSTTSTPLKTNVVNTTTPIESILPTQKSPFTPPYHGTIFDFPDAFTDNDPTAFIGITYKGQEIRNAFDRRINKWANIKTYIYVAEFNDGCNPWEMIVNAEFSQSEAKKLAEKYAFNIGQLPICIRSSINGAVIHDGYALWGGGNPLTIHHEYGLDYERQGIITETMFHEATHGAIDPKYYTKEWESAANKDNGFISKYAQDYPEREDHSETMLCWFVAKFKSDRISSVDYKTITTSIPNRIKFYDNQNFNISPIKK